MDKQPSSFLPAILEFGSNILTAAAIASAGGILLVPKVVHILRWPQAAGAGAAFMLILAVLWLIFSVARLHQHSQFTRFWSMVLVVALLLAGVIMVSIVFVIASVLSSG